MSDATRKIPLETIIRILLIPLFLFLIYSAYQNYKDITITSAGKKLFERSLSEPWPTAYGQLTDGKMTLWHENSYKKGDMMHLLPSYSYRIGTQACSSNRFEFGPRKTDYTDIMPGDPRLARLVKAFCPSPPKKTVEKNRTVYTYSCYPMKIHYDPQNVCVSYIERPANPDSVRAALQKNVTLFGGLLVLKLIVAALCVWGVLPLLNSFKK